MVFHKPGLWGFALDPFCLRHTVVAPSEAARWCIVKTSHCGPSPP